MDAQFNEERLEKSKKFLKPIKYILVHIIAPIRGLGFGMSSLSFFYCLMPFGLFDRSLSIFSVEHLMFLVLFNLLALGVFCAASNEPDSRHTPFLYELSRFLLAPRCLLRR